MNKKNTTSINIAEIIAPIISSRDIINCLEKFIKKASTNNVALDFADVQFISRSAAHQMLIFKENLANKSVNKKIISFINASDNVADMLRLVAASRALPRKRKIEFTAEAINIQSLISQI